MRPALASALLFLAVHASILGSEQSWIRRLAGAPVERQAIVGQFDRVIPLVLNGRGYKTSFVFTNLDTRTVYVDFIFIGDNGQELELPVAGIGLASGLYGSIGVNQTVTFETDGSGDLKQGWVRFFSLDRPADDPRAEVAKAIIGGMAVVHGSTMVDDPGFETTVSFAPAYETRFMLQFDNRGGMQTVLILVNGTSIPSPLKVLIRDRDGTLLAQDEVTFYPSERRAVVLHEIFPQTKGQTGIIQVSTDAVGLSGLGLREDPNGRFTTVQTLSSPTDPNAPKPPTALPSGSLPGIGSSCASIEGALLFANDGQYLGKVTSNSNDSESLGNQYGRYGSPYSSTSIFNQYGTYGGPYSALSPFNPYTSTPPVLYVNNKPVVYLTANRNKTPGLDPTAIYPCVGRR